MNKVQFIKDCLTDYFSLENKTVGNDNRLFVMDTIRLEYPRQFKHLEILDILRWTGNDDKQDLYLFEEALDGLAILVAKSVNLGGLDKWV